jgi:hypothetical protein
MGLVGRLGVLAILLFAAPSVAAAQTVAPAPVLTPEEMETFLLNARILETRRAGDGVTGVRRVTMTDGRLTHDASLQDIDEWKAIFETPQGTELNFRDSYRYNVAAYRLARLLQIDNVPVTVERRVQGKDAALMWWVDDVAMDEGDRVRNRATDPNPQRATAYVYRQRLFDELIQNVDRNLGNLLYTRDWKMWMIDHSRSFRLGRELRKPEQLPRAERVLFENLKTMTTESLTAAVGRALNALEIEAVLARRDALVRHFETRVAQSSEGAVFYTMPR